MYKDLETRLRKIPETIEEETQSWVIQCANAFQTSDRVASNLKSQSDQFHLYFSSSPRGITITLEMEKDNPFVWTMVPPHPNPLAYSKLICVCRSTLVDP
jgi:hypothetical protein